MTQSLAPLSPRVKRYVAASRAANTVRAYKSHWAAFQRYCTRNGLSPLPAAPEAITSYLAEMSKHYKVSTIESHLAAIAEAHKLAGQANPTQNTLVEMTLGGIRRELGTRPTKKSAATRDVLTRFLATLPTTLAGLRDKALLQVGFAGAFRRSEIVAVRCEDCEFPPAGGVRILLRRSKTDQTGEGTLKHIPATARGLRAAESLRAWLSASNITDGPVFRAVSRAGKVGQRGLSDKHVARLIKHCAEAAGLDAEKFSGHSLRSGFVTEGILRKLPVPHIQKVTGHKSTRVLMGYVAETGLIQNEAVAAVLGDE